MPDSPFKGRGAGDIQALRSAAEALRTTALTAAKRRIPAGLRASEADASQRRRRIELLDLSNDEDLKRWQEIYNQPEKYSVISEKVSTVRGEHTVDYTSLVTYYEIGDDLPVTRARNDLRESERPAGPRLRTASHP